MDFKYLIVDRTDDIVKVTINKPKSLNALNSEVLSELSVCFHALEEDREVSVIVITGEGKAFVAGADISEMQPLSSAQAYDFAKLAMDTFMLIEHMSKPVIAAVNGYALGGGCELSLACDIRIASEKAVFGQPEVGLGITPGFGGTQRLARTVGAGFAKEMIYTAKSIKADRALEIGLVNQVVPPEELEDAAMEMAKTIAGNAKLAVSYAKKAIVDGLQTDIHTGMDIEKLAFSLCFATEDQKEGMKAFLEKRGAEFKGE